MYCHLPKISLWHTRLTKSQSHLQQIPPISFILPQFCAHDALKSHRTTLNRVCSFTHSASDHPSTPPPVVPHQPFLGPPAIAVQSIHGGARGEELLNSGGAAPSSRQVQRCPTSGAEGLGDVNGWLHPVALHRPPPHLTGRGSNVWSEVREFHLLSKLYSELAQWQPLPLLVFLKITKTTN